MNQPILDNFLSQYSKTNTKNAYKLQLNKYFEYYNIDATKYLSNGRNYQNDIDKYMKHLNLVKTPPKTRTLAVTAIKMFLLYNLKDYDKKLPPSFWFKQTRGKNKGSKAVTLDKVPMPDDLKKILQYSNIQGKTLFLTLATSGMRVNEALSLTWDDIDLESNPVHIEIPANITKNGLPRHAFVTNETRDCLIAWKKIRKEYLVSAVKKSNAAPKELNDPRIFPFSYQNAWDMWKTLLKNAGLTKSKYRDKTTGRYQYHIHALRKFFRSRLPKLISVDFVEYLMGHEGYLTEQYRSYPVKELADEYLKGMDRLLIFETPADTSDIRESLLEKDKQIQDLQNTMEDMKAQILELRLEKLEKANGIKNTKK